MAENIDKKKNTRTGKFNTRKAVDDLLEKLNYREFDDLDSFLKNDVEWRKFDPKLFLPQDKICGFISSIHDEEIRLNVIKFLLKYEELYFKTLIVHDYNKNSQWSFYTEKEYKQKCYDSDDPLRTFHSTLKALQDQIESKGEFSVKKLKELTEENKQLRQQNSELLTLINGEKGQNVSIPPLEKQKNKPGRKKKKTKEQYGDPSCILRDTDLDSKKRFEEICNSHRNATSSFRELKNNEDTYFYLSAYGYEELCYYLNENAKGTKLYSNGGRFTPSIIKNVNKEFNKKMKEKKKRKEKLLTDDQLANYQ